MYERYIKSVNTGNIFQIIDSTHIGRIGYMEDGDFVKFKEAFPVIVPADWIESALKTGIFEEVYHDRLSDTFYTADQIAALADSRV